MTPFNASSLCRVCHHCEWREIAHHVEPVGCEHTHRRIFGHVFRTEDCPDFDSRVDWPKPGADS